MIIAKKKKCQGRYTAMFWGMHGQNNFDFSLHLIPLTDYLCSFVVAFLEVENITNW